LVCNIKEKNKKEKAKPKTQRNIVEKELAGQGGKQNYKPLQTKIQN